MAKNIRAAARAVTLAPAVRKMMEGAELARLGIGSNSGADPLDLSSIADAIKAGDKAGVMALAKRLGGEASEAMALGGTTKVRALVGVAIAVHKAQLDISATGDKDLAVSLVKSYAPTLSDVSIKGAVSYLRRAVICEEKGVLRETLNVLKVEHDAFTGPKKAFENAFYDACQIAKQGKAPTKKEVLTLLPKPVKVAPAKPDATKVAPLSFDEIMANLAKTVASETANMDDKPFETEVKKFAALIIAARKELKKAKPTEGKEVIQRGKGAKK